MAEDAPPFLAEMGAKGARRNIRLCTTLRGRYSKGVRAFTNSMSRTAFQCVSSATAARTGDVQQPEGYFKGG
jgi:hypothetical protein